MDEKTLSDPIALQRVELEQLDVDMTPLGQLSEDLVLLLRRLPPAMQTCPDGSQVLATQACAAPPPPPPAAQPVPPPPAAAPVGERG